MRPSNVDASEGALDELVRIVAQIREAWPDVRILARGDSGFCREALMAWCEDSGVDYVFGVARNARLVRKIARQMRRSRSRCVTTGRPSRRFRDFRHRTLTSWSRSRRVVGKAEMLPGLRGANPRFVVTSLSGREIGARALYEDLYRARGDMENRIKEQQLDLFADRTSTATMRANQLRLHFSAFARDPAPDRPLGRPRRHVAVARNTGRVAAEGGLPAPAQRAPGPAVPVLCPSAPGALRARGARAATGRGGAPAVTADPAASQPPGAGRTSRGGAVPETLADGTPPRR